VADVGTYSSAAGAAFVQISASTSVQNLHLIAGVVIRRPSTVAVQLFLRLGRARCRSCSAAVPGRRGRRRRRVPGRLRAGARRLRLVRCGVRRCRWLLDDHSWVLSLERRADTYRQNIGEQLCKQSEFYRLSKR